MPSTATNRLQGLTTSVAVKPPCITVATTNITLSGLQTISSVTVIEGDRVLVKGQSIASENGIYNASTGNWTRAKDFDGDLDAVSGTRVLVRGTSIAVEYELTTADPIVIGTTNLTFTLRYGANGTYDRTEAEIAAGVTPVNYQYPPGVVDRYATNTVPGTTDMTAAIQAALDVANAGLGKATLLHGVYLTGNINWPGNNLSLVGAGSAYGYNSSATPKTILRAKTGTTIILDLVQTGTAEDRTGNYIADLEVDGNSLCSVGIDSAGSNLFERVRGYRCTGAGLVLESFANATRINHCAFTLNTGWGMIARGVAATTFSVSESNFSLNTLGGVNLETGVVVKFSKCVIESNAGPGLRLYRPSSHTNAMSHFQFDECWFEDNGSATPFYTIVIDSETPGDSSKHPERILFDRCRIATSGATRKYHNIGAAKWVMFDTCYFASSTEANALNLSSNSIFVAYLDCSSALLSGGLTETQIDNAIAQGTRCYASDRDIKRSVGGSSPAVAFSNSWVNNGGAYNAAKYWFDRMGNVHLEGTIKTGSVPSAAFTLPVGYRPPTQFDFAVESNGAYGMCSVSTDGQVTPTVGSSTRFCLNGISFPTG